MSMQLSLAWHAGLTISADCGATVLLFCSCCASFHHVWRCSCEEGITLVFCLRSHTLLSYTVCCA